MVTRPSEKTAAPPAADDDWLVAGQVAVDAERLATIAFNRFGDARLTLALERPPAWADVAALERTADVLPHLRLTDLAAAEDYRDRHATAFEIDPLPARRFNQTCEIELVAPPGGVAVPRGLGALGVPVRLVEVSDGEPAAPAPPDRVAGAAGRVGEVVTDWFGALGGALVRLTRLEAETLCRIGLGLAVVAFIVVFTNQTWTNHARFGTYGFDLGIFDQGAWLLSRFHNPFITIRGLNLFGDHASFILILVAPLYRIWPDPRLLLLLQVVFLAAPAVVVYVLGNRRLGNPAAALVVALAYLAYPAMQWAASWQFHPETLAAGFLAAAVLAADARRPVALGVLIALALLCKEDVGLVVAGFGAMLWVNGQAVWGRRVLAAGLGWFLLATFVLIAIANGRGSPFFRMSYDIDGSGPLAVLGSMPSLAGRALSTALNDTGLPYLALVFVPLALLPLLSWRSLLPVVPPILLSLAATNPYYQKITYQYLATSAPFLALAAAAGLAVATARRRWLLAPLCLVLIVTALTMDVRYGPAPWSRTPALGDAPAQTAALNQALAAVPADVPMSAQFNLVSHLAHRRVAYEFPNPFRAVNWGLPGTEHDPAEAAKVEWVLVQPSALSKDDQELLRGLRNSLDWRTAYDHDGVVLLERVRR